MEKKEANYLIFLFLLMVVGGLAVIAASIFTTNFSTISVKGTRAIGFSLLFIGIGEWLNHPVQKSMSAPGKDSSTVHTLIHRRRNACGLGNVFDVFGLILIFIAFSLFFFPRQ